MGVLSDYFRAADAASVVQALEQADGGSPLFTKPPVFDGVEAEGVGRGSRTPARWMRAEELQGARCEDVQPLAEELVLLARRARSADERLYCWMSL